MGVADVIGVFGGTGFYEFLEEAQEVKVDTPYGQPSAPATVGQIGEVDVVFIPRHGRRHEFPPHLVPYRANAWAFRELGVDRIIGPCAAGSLTPSYEPGHFVVADQLVDRTHGRDSTFFDDIETKHISFADPYCPELRPLAIAAAREAGATVHERGTDVIVQGPRFSTRAESQWYARAGWELINMTQLPEASLARELEICYVNVAVITDYDVGVEGEIEPVTHRQVIEGFKASLGTLRQTIRNFVGPASQTPRNCPCARSLADAAG
ncbi:MAG: S-methyl-5'-thioadenosine phosphorylase [Acidimicrobiia bacterium]